MSKVSEIIKKLKLGKKVPEIDLLDYESRGYTNVLKHRIRKTLGYGKELVVKNGIWMIRNCAGIGGLLIMAILVVVMSILSYYIGKPDSIDSCLIEFGITDAEIDG